VRCRQARDVCPRRQPVELTVDHQNIVPDFAKRQIALTRQQRAEYGGDDDEYPTAQPRKSRAGFRPVPQYQLTPRIDLPLLTSRRGTWDASKHAGNAF
jgi:hypothetical protein